MGCLFGYCGTPANGLLERMAELLNHRCARGWERAWLKLSDGPVVEIGHGIAPWAAEPHVTANEEQHLALGYSGYISNGEEVCGEKGNPHDPRIGCDVGVLPAGSAASGWNPGLKTDNSFSPYAGGGQREVPLVAQLLTAFRTNAEDRLEALEGAFVSALAHGDRFILLRDPSGVKVIYWTVHKDRFVFASEIKALFADPSVPRKMRMGALPEYLTFSFVPGEGTMFENIQELQPGTMLQYRGGEVSIRRHFVFENMEWNGQGRHSEEEYAERLRVDLERSVHDCCAVSSEPPAVFLSGGIDSSAVLALTALKYIDIPVQTFSVHFGSKYANENDFVSMMVNSCNTKHTWLEIRPSRFIRRMRRIIWNLDDPIGDPITVPNFLLAEAASKVTNVVLNGEGGDPCFGGPKNIPMLLADLYGPLPGESPKAWLERNYLLSYRKCFSELDRMLDPAVLREAGGEEALTSIITPFLEAPRPRTLLNKLMAINIRLKGANLILVKVDKMTSANGVLALPPLFSKRVVEASMSCPPGLKLVGNVEKGILKRAVADIVPAPIVQRPKSGMMVPVRFWLRGEMRRYARRVLSKKNLERVGFFKVEYVRKLLDYDRAEIQSFRYGLKLWMLITFMLWHEQLIEGKN
jgi:asparagine synthase (glutamine-hydrolysing)